MLLTSSAHAETKLIAIGSISGAYEDLALETAAPASLSKFELWDDD